MGSAKPENQNDVFATQVALLSLAGFIGSLVSGFLPSWFASLFQVTLEAVLPYRYALFIAALLIIPAFCLS